MTTNAIAPATRSSIRLVDRYFPRNKRREALYITAEPNARHEADQCRFRDGEDSQNGRRAAAAATHRCEEAGVFARSVTLDQVERYCAGGLVPDGQFGVKAVLDEGESVMLSWGILLDEIEDLYLTDGNSDRRDPLGGLRLVRYVDEDDEFGTPMVRIEEDWASDGTPVTYRVMEMRIYG